MAAAGFCAGTGSARSSDREGKIVIPASLADMALLALLAQREAAGHGDAAPDHV